MGGAIDSPSAISVRQAPPVPLVHLLGTWEPEIEWGA
jgi:hypothetical protein